jgi:hypothetical protein
VVIFFSCTTVSGKSVVSAVPAMECTGGDYDSLTPLFLILLIVVVIGGPLAMLAFLVWGYAHRRLQAIKWHQRFGVL